MTRRNIPAGWAAFRALRQTPHTIRAPRHGNWKHGLRSLKGQAEMRMLRRTIRLLDWLEHSRGRTMPDFMGKWFPPRPLGWRGYLARRPPHRGSGTGNSFPPRDGA